MLNRNLSLATLAAIATPWAGAMTLAGLWLLAGGPEAERIPQGFRFVLGMTAIAAGQLVFMCLVADRVFPLADRRAVWWVEVFTCVVLFGGALWLGVLAIS